MFNVWNSVFLCIFYYISVRCLIPTLNVQRLDKRLIERKRQNTLDMCRMFTEETERLDRVVTNDIQNHNSMVKRRRVKRDLQLANSTLNYDEAKRVEGIVDKLYDDMTINGERVTYRQRELPITTVKIPANVQNQSGRRFHFAPAELLPPLPSSKRPKIGDVDSIKLPWTKRWKHGIVPFFIDSNTYDSQLSEIIISAFDSFEKVTCIRLQRLREKPTDKESLLNVEWLYISNPSGIRQCVHSNEARPNQGVQMVVFGYDCMSVGEIHHEVMHILGFSHEHTRPDRDQHITVLWDNIKHGYKKYFELRDDDILINLPYDHASVLHYPARAFSKNGQITLLTQPGIKVGQRDGLSDGDITKVTTIYGSECLDRNREYLLKTCPSVVRTKPVYNNVTQEEIEEYFKERLWPYGIVNYKIKDRIEFSTEELENINAVINHIEKETCIEFRDASIYEVEDSGNSDNQDKNQIISKEEIEKLKTAYSQSEKSDSIAENIIDTNTNHDSENEIKPINSDDNIDTRKRSGTNSDHSIGLTKSLNSIKDPKSKSYVFGNLSKNKSPISAQNARVRRAAGPPLPSRRHAENTLTLVRSLEPGCQCPPPGKPRAEQELKINADCFNSVNELLHFFVHVLGLEHQHNMNDRDSYLHIIWDNLTPEINEEMQEKLPPAASVGFPYDYQSVMHYPWLQIKNGVTNIMYPIWNDGWAMGHWQGLSSTDVNKLNVIYNKQCLLRKEHDQN